MKERTAIVLSLVWLLMGVTAWANDDGESRRAEVVLEVGEIDSSRKEHIQAQANSSRDEGGLQVRSDSLSGRMARGDAIGRTGKRIARKLGAGAITGIVPSSALGIILTTIISGNTDGNTEDFGAGFFFEFSLIFGYPIGAAIGVSWVDPHDRFILPLAGSWAGFIAGAYALPPNETLSIRERWPLFAGSLVGATIMSELWRKSPESRRFSLGVAPDRQGGLSVVATLRF